MMVFSMDELLSVTGLTSPLVGGTIGLIVLLNLTFRYYSSSSSSSSSSSLFQRDGVGNSFGGSITGSVSLLSNPDSMIQRENVKDEMENYDNMFLGARTNVGSLHKQESIEKRQKEYQTMVNSFYNLVTDFYEYGWGQVNDVICLLCYFFLQGCCVCHVFWFFFFGSCFVIQIMIFVGHVLFLEFFVCFVFGQYLLYDGTITMNEDSQTSPAYIYIYRVLSAAFLLFHSLTHHTHTQQNNK